MTLSLSVSDVKPCFAGSSRWDCERSSWASNPEVRPSFVGTQRVIHLTSVPLLAVRFFQQEQSSNSALSCLTPFARARKSSRTYDSFSTTTLPSLRPVRRPSFECRSAVGIWAFFTRLKPSLVLSCTTGNLTLTLCPTVTDSRTQMWQNLLMLSGETTLGARLWSTG